MIFKKYDKVKVSPMATGLGEWLTGWIDEISQFAGRTFISIRYDRPAPDGTTGNVFTNLRLLEKSQEDENKFTSEENDNAKKIHINN